MDIEGKPILDSSCYCKLTNQEHHQVIENGRLWENCSHYDGL